MELSAGGGEGEKVRRREDAAGFLSSAVWENCVLHTAAVPRNQDKKQRSGEGRGTIVDYYNPRLQNARLSHSP